MKSGKTDRLLDEAIRSVLGRTSRLFGEEYFDSITLEIARVLDADCIFIGTLAKDRVGRVEPVSLCADGKIVDGFSYDLAGTPCDEVMGKSACYFPAGVAELFPADTVLAEMGIEAYAGVPLFDSRGAELGIIVAMFKTPRPDEGICNSMMLVFAARTAAEIERIAMERRHANLERKLLHAQKLESLGVLAGGIAHDFNNMLCGILGGADLVSAALDEDHPAGKNVELIRDTAHQAAELCRELLAYSGKGRFVARPICLTELVESTSELLNVSISKNVELHQQLADDLPAVEADASQLRQVLLNLVINATESIGDRSGLIVVKTGLQSIEADTGADDDSSQELSAGDYVFIEVTDNGCGMDEVTRQQIFDPFFTTKPEGRGLGLAATLGIVRGHGGATRVSSGPGVGTTIRVLLPASTHAKATDPTSEPVDRAWTGSGTVLFVDDDELVRSIGKQMLEQLGFEVLLAHNGINALAIFRERADEIRLVILDLTMPVMSGAETLRELHRADPYLKVILISGFDRESVPDRIGSEPFTDFIQKPFNHDDLRRQIRRAIDGETVHRTPATGTR